MRRTNKHFAGLFSLCAHFGIVTHTGSCPSCYHTCDESICSHPVVICDEYVHCLDNTDEQNCTCEYRARLPVSGVSSAWKPGGMFTPPGSNMMQLNRILLDVVLVCRAIKAVPRTRCFAKLHPVPSA